MSPTRFTSTTTARPSPSRHSRSIGPDVGRVLAPHEREVVAQRGDPRREQLLQLGLDTVLLEAGVVAELEGRVVQHLVQLDAQRLALGGAWRRSRRRSSIVHGGFIQLSGL